MDPQVSVVMGVYNGASVLQKTMDSVIGQEGVELEFIIVDDGSTDETREILDARSATDSRVRVIHQDNQGLTAALVKGCNEARGEFIARQDNGDVSIHDRLRKQAARLIQDRSAVMCSSFAGFEGPRGEHLYTVSIGEDALNLTGSGKSGKLDRGPAHHGAVMMRRDAYEAIGGYRGAFYFAQDIDLWSRLTERGRHVVVPEVLYRARLDPSSISGRYANEQRCVTDLIWQAADARRAGKDEGPILRAAEGVRAQGRGAGRRGIAAGAYFIASCLQTRDPGAARGYFLAAVANNPLHLKAWLRLAGFGRRTQRIG